MSHYSSLAGAKVPVSEFIGSGDDVLDWGWHSDGYGFDSGYATPEKCLDALKAYVANANPAKELFWDSLKRRRKGTDDAGCALRDHQFRVRDNEHRCADKRQAQCSVEDFG